MRLPDPPQRRAGRAPAGDRRQVPGAPDARRRGHVRRAGRARLARALSSRAALRARPARRRGGRVRSTSTAASTPPCSSRSTSPGGELHAVFTAPARRPAPPRRRDLVPRRAPGRRRDRPAADRAARGPGGDRPAARRRRAGRRAAADADVRHQLRGLSLRRADRARPRVGALGHRGRRGARAAAARRCAPATSAGGWCAAACRSAPTSTSSASDLIWGATARMVGDLLDRLPDDLGLSQAAGSARSDPGGREVATRPSRSGRRRGCPTRSTSRRSS